ncbi:uncharacterized protein LOC124915022 [Impatiens glandulifera]|uniref:uncharacterized protein LOC124915022 n=1 Tax=Impatiens glandulifera TaxID=253017 RepID=UPI001FB14B70|nr:uncharacterized protein LOC124915022 [Impatiens glandulifera]
MATSSFKSTTSRRGTTTRTRTESNHNPKSSDEKNASTANTKKKPPPRRSQSVSAISRTKQLDLSSEFLNKIDNPLFSTGYDNEEVEQNSNFHPKTPVACNPSQRGRSSTRNADLFSNKNEEKKETVGRRHRSVSRTRSISSNESPVEGIPIWEDAISVASLSEIEEKTINAVWEQTMSLAVDDSRDYMSNDEIDMTNPVPIDDDVILVDVRSDYARKLNECHERARRLRADLAAEENHEHELGRILKDILSEPITITTNVKSSPTERKKSSERRRMSRRLAEEAMTYFDECVSISTFDSSDFSAAEDATSVSASNYPVSRFSDRQGSLMFDQPTHNPLESDLVASSSTKSCLDQSGCKITELGMKFQFSSDQKKLADNYSDQPNIRNDSKDMGKYFVGDDMEKRRSSCFNIDDYKLCSLAEELLYERVLHRNRIESGNLHLCGGGGMTTLHSFSSLI